MPVATDSLRCTRAAQQQKLASRGERPLTAARSVLWLPWRSGVNDRCRVVGPKTGSEPNTRTLQSRPSYGRCKLFHLNDTFRLIPAVALSKIPAPYRPLGLQLFLAAMWRRLRSPLSAYPTC